MDSSTPCATALWQEAVGEPYAGNPHVRFDEGEQSDGVVDTNGLLPTLLVNLPSAVLAMQLV